MVKVFMSHQVLLELPQGLKLPILLMGKIGLLSKKEANLESMEVILVDRPCKAYSLPDKKAP